MVMDCNTRRLNELFLTDWRRRDALHIVETMGVKKDKTVYLINS